MDPTAIAQQELTSLQTELKQQRLKEVQEECHKHEEQLERAFYQLQSFDVSLVL